MLALTQGLMSLGAGGGGGYAYWNPLDKSASATLSDLDRLATRTSSGTSWVRSVTSKNAGKWRVQFVLTPFASTHGVGFATSASTGSFLGGNAAGWAYWGNYGTDGRTYHSGAFVNFASQTLATNDRVDLLIDIDAGRAWWRINGTVISGDPVAGTGAMLTFTPGTTLFLACDCFGINGATRLRTDPAEMVDSPVSGFTDGWPV
jgi:hypothetical protein